MGTMIKLNGLINIQSGFAFKSNLFSQESGMPIIRIRNVSSGKVSTLYTGDFKEEFIVNDGDLLISMDGEFKCKRWNGGKALLNQRVCRIFVKDKRLMSNYLDYVLPRELKRIEDETSFVTVKHLSAKSIKEIKIPLPPLATQKKIVRLLDAAQELIDKRKAQIALLDELVKSTFYTMFGDPVTNPMGWEKKKLEEACDVYRGGSPRPINNFLGGSIPWIKIGDATMGDDIYLRKTKEHIIKDGVKKSRLVEKGSLIFANCGVSLGFARIVTFDGCIHDGWLSFEKISNELNSLYLLKLLNSYTEYFRNSAPNGTQPNLNTKIMKVFYIIIPPITLQNKFAQKVQAIEAQKAKMQQGLKQMEDLFASLMQRAFRGEIE